MRLALSLSIYWPSILTLTPRPPNKRPVPEKIHPPDPRPTSEPHRASLSISHPRGPRSLGRDHSQHQCCLPPAFVFFTTFSETMETPTRWRSFCLLPRRRGRSSTPSMWPRLGRRLHPKSIGSQLCSSSGKGVSRIRSVISPTQQRAFGEDDFFSKIDSIVEFKHASRRVSLPFACRWRRKFLHPFWHLPSRFRVLPQN